MSRLPACALAIGCAVLAGASACTTTTAAPRPRPGQSSRAVSSASPTTSTVCRLLTTGQVAAAFGGPVTAVAVALPGELGGSGCLWTAAGQDADLGRVLSLEQRRDADLDASARASGITARSVLEETVAAQSGGAQRVGGVGVEAFAAHQHVWVVLGDGSTLTLDDRAGLGAAASLALAREAVEAAR